MISIDALISQQNAIIEKQTKDAMDVMAQAGREIDRLRARVAELEDRNLATVAKLNRMFDALEECREYFDGRADAEYETDRASPIGNEEMRMLVMIDQALGRIP